MKTTMTLLLAVFFLSSNAAQARRSDVTTVPSPTQGVHRVLYSGVSDNVGNWDLLSATPIRTAFERANPPIQYFFAWPQLPTESEVLVKIATDRLAELMRQHEAEIAPIENDFEKIWMTLLGALTILGLCCFTVAGTDTDRLSKS